MKQSQNQYWNQAFKLKNKELRDEGKLWRMDMSSLKKGRAERESEMKIKKKTKIERRERNEESGGYDSKIIHQI
jgi:hypothetical protein